MRKSMLVTSVALGLWLLPAASSAQQPDWVFEVPLDLQSLNQQVDHVRVNCRVRAASGQLLGMTLGDEIQVDAQGNVSGLATVPVSAGNVSGGATYPGEVGGDPGTGHSYVCYLQVHTADGDWEDICRSWSDDEILTKSQPGTPCISPVEGSIFP